MDNNGGTLDVGDIMTVQVEDVDLDTDTTTKQTLTVAVNDGNGDSINVLLTETLNSSGIFLGQFSVAGNGNNSDLTSQLGANKGDTITALYTDANDAGGNPVTVSATAIVAKALLLWSTTTLNEATANDGSFTETITITLVGGDTFVNKSPFVFNSDYHIGGDGNISGASFAITRNSSTELSVSISGKVTSHGDAADAELLLILNERVFTSGTEPKGIRQHISFNFNE